MQQSPEEIINNHLDAYLLVCKKTTEKQTIEARSAELTAITKQPAFLTAAHRLLTNPSAFPQDRKEKEILLTSLVKDKFKYEFETIENDMEGHYQQLCEIAQSLQQTTYAAYTNIALSLAYTYLHVVATHAYSLEAFLKPFLPSDSSQTRLYNYYFKTLEYIATEIENNKFVIDQGQRQAAHEKLVGMQISVLQILNENAGRAFEIEEINKENIMYCFEAWISVHYDPNVLNSVPEHIMFRKVLEHVQDEDCGEGAGNCLRSIICQLKTPAENRPIYDALTKCTMQILELVERTVADMETEKGEDFIRIIADFALKSIDIFIENFDRNIEAFLRKLIIHMRDDLMNTYKNIADVFEEFLNKVKKVQQEGQLSVHPDIYGLLDPLYDALCYKCMLPLRVIKELNQTDENKAHHISSMVEEVLSHREFTEDVFDCISQVQGKTAYLQFVYGKMTKLSPGDDKHFWPYLEIYLYSLMDAVRDYPAMDATAASLLQMYLELTAQPESMPICVRRTFLRVFRAIITSKDKNAEFIYRVMCIAVTCFEEPLLYSVAEKTFCRACEHNTNIAVHIFKEFGPVLEKYPERDYIVKGLVTVICSDGELTKTYLAQVLSFLFGKFKEEMDKGKRKEYMHSINAALKAFKESLVAKQHMPILQGFMRDIWPFCKNILASPQRLKDDEDSDVERVVRILKILMRTLEHHFAEFLEELFTTVLSAFRKHPICSYVYLVEVAVTVYATSPAYIDYMRRLYSDFCEIAYQHMKQIEDMGRYSYFLDDFMGMNKRFFVYNASVVLSSGKLPDIIEICINGFMGCDIPRIAKAAYSFFETIFMVYWRPEFIQQRNANPDLTPFLPKSEDLQHYQALKAFLLQKVQQIVSKMLEHLETAPTEQTRDYILDALLSEIKGFTHENPTIWRFLLARIPAEILVQKEKERMVEMLESLTTCDFEASRKTLKSLDKMLVLINRRIINTNKRKNIDL